MGHHPARTCGHGPRYLVSDLGQFDFGESLDQNLAVTRYQPRMRLVSYHPGVSINYIQAHTGFTLEIAPNVGPTPEPSAEELRILREEIDPLGIRRLEALSGAERRQLLHEILKKEK
jgi:hypothetical protein